MEGIKLRWQSDHYIELSLNERHQLKKLHDLGITGMEWFVNSSIEELRKREKESFLINYKLPSRFYVYYKTNTIHEVYGGDVKGEYSIEDLINEVKEERIKSLNLKISQLLRDREKKEKEIQSLNELIKICQNSIKEIIA